LVVHQLAQVEPVVARFMLVEVEVVMERVVVVVME
jgi:hypothetical protein